MIEVPLDVVKGEKKYLKFLVRDKATGLPLNLSAVSGGYSVNLVVYSGTTALLTVTNANFLKTDQASGIVKALCDFSSATENKYFGEFKLTYTSSGLIHKKVFEIKLGQGYTGT